MERFILKIWTEPAKLGSLASTMFMEQSFDNFHEIRRAIHFLKAVNQELKADMYAYELHLVHPCSMFHVFSYDNATQDIADCIETCEDGKTYNHFKSYVNATIPLVERADFYKFLKENKIKNIGLIKAKTGTRKKQKCK